MITRFVKLTFKEETVSVFQEIFATTKDRIAAFPGCNGVALHRDVQNPEVFFTISEWNSISDLNAYRKSELFEETWAKTKVLFADKPEAWSLEIVPGS